MVIRNAEVGARYFSSLTSAVAVVHCRSRKIGSVLHRNNNNNNAGNDSLESAVAITIQRSHSSSDDNLELSAYDRQRPSDEIRER